MTMFHMVVNDHNPSQRVKRYLRYPMITSQNVSSETQLRIFLCCRKAMFHSEDIQVFIFLPCHDLRNL